MNEHIIEFTHKDMPEALFPQTSDSLAAMPNTTQRLAFLYNVLAQFGNTRRLNGQLQTILEHVISMIPGADRGVVLLRDCERDTLLLKAYVSPDGPAINTTLVRRAMEEKQEFIWRRPEADENNGDNLPTQTAIYAPLLWQGDAFGVLCVDTAHAAVTFTAEDVQFILVVARCMAMAIVNYQLQEENRQTSKVLARLLKTFSPQIREKLVERAHHGHLRPGGKKSEVTILYADIRGFTKMSADRDAEDVLDILNAYFSALIKIIFKYDGTIDKFIGDEILAVFGSPEHDPDQHAKAVRAAWEMQAAMKALNVERAARGEVTCEIGIGIHCGEVLHGFIGSAERIEFTVIGDAVNRASRYCDGAGAGEVLISPEVYQRVWETVKEERTTITTKHEGDLNAYRLREINLRE